jgi:CRISPR/Cas system-associated endonuclease Cas3-HD
MKLTLIESEAKIILEAMTELENKYNNICHVSDDDDEIAEYGNDLIELRLLLKVIREKATETYGPSVLNFSRELL